MADKTPVHQAWSAVMKEVQGLGKNNRAHQFNFRGIDDVMNAFGPALRKHGVYVVPEVLKERMDSAPGANGKMVHTSHVTVRFTVVGPEGDTFSGSAAGEGNDFADKATSKAMSVAYRTFMLQAACLPTQEPDPDLGGEHTVPGPDWAGNYAAAKAQGPEAFKNFLAWAASHDGPPAMIEQGRAELEGMK